MAKHAFDGADGALPRCLVGQAQITQEVDAGLQLNACVRIELRLIGHNEAGPVELQIVQGDTRWLGDCRAPVDDSWKPGEAVGELPFTLIRGCVGPDRQGVAQSDLNRTGREPERGDNRHLGPAEESRHPSAHRRLVYPVAGACNGSGQHDGLAFVTRVNHPDDVRDGALRDRDRSIVKNLECLLQSFEFHFRVCPALCER
ncbi:MAG: hypothetical protein KF710_09685 [Rhodocyclaceae bacterium]|nr:hypothetical protein [Rhodocyclaceae bacterium]